MIKSIILSLLILAGSFSGIKAEQSILELAQTTDELSTLVDLLSLTGLDQALDCNWFCYFTQFTVFAPNNDAFAALDDALVTKLRDDPDWRLHLTETLLYHVAPGKLYSQRIVNQGTIEVPTLSIQGGSVTATAIDNGGVTLNGDQASVVTADLEANNGLVHVIDGVLVPSFLQNSIYDLVESSDRFTTLRTAIDAAELQDTLSGDGPFTVFAPTDEAFARLPDGALEELLNDPTGKLRDVLLYHVVPNTILASHDIRSGTLDTALEGFSVDVGFTGPFWNPGISIDDARVIRPDILASNGIVHIIDKVLIPPEAPASPTGDIIDVATQAGGFGTLLTALDAAELTDTLRGDGPFTVFAPTDAAFSDLPDGLLEDLLADTDALTDILTYHVLEGETVRADLDTSVLTCLNGANLFVTRYFRAFVLNGSTRIEVYDIPASNGVIHVIDRVLQPYPTIYERVSSNPAFSTLQLALDTAGLNTTLDEEDGPFTVFAPLIVAFEKLGNEAIQGLLQDSEALSNILLYHVVAGNVLSKDLTEGSAATLLEGQSFEVSFEYGILGLYVSAVKINGNANIVFVDVRCRNGIVHVIDEVLIPPSLT